MKILKLTSGEMQGSSEAIHYSAVNLDCVELI
jgi:hypothetical protein